MRKTYCFLFALLSLCLRVVAQVGVEPLPLGAGQNIEREIAGGQTHTYQLTLAAGQFMQALVEQKGVDVKVTLVSPDQKSIEVDQPFGSTGLESLSHEAAVSGDYQIAIQFLSAPTTKGIYQIRLEVKATTTAQDKQRVVAERLLAEAERLRQQGVTATQQAIEKAQQSLTTWQTLGDRYWEASALFCLGWIYATSSQYERAIEYYELALAGFREARSQVGEAATLTYIGFAYSVPSRYEKVIEYHGQALGIYRAMKNPYSEVDLLNSLGNDYRILNQYEKAIEYHQQALAIAREVKARTREGIALFELGADYYLSNQYEKAIEYHEQVLALYRQVTGGWRKGATLWSLGNIYSSMRQYEKAVEYYEQALVASREVRQRYYEGLSLASLGVTFSALSMYEKATESFEKALAISREIRSPLLEGRTLNYAGDLYRTLYQYEKAISYYGQALRVQRGIKNRDKEAFSLNNLMLSWKGHNQPNLAIFFGKQAVNNYQNMRSGLRSLDQETQQSFLKSKEYTYRELADLLIAQGRLPEAEQVIRMLKEDEYFEYIRRDETNSPKAEKAALTPEEEKVEKRYREIADKLTELGTERSALLDKQPRTSAEEQRLANLEADLVVAGQAFQKFLDGLASEMGKNADTNARAFQLRESQGLMEDLRELGKGTVALYTLVGEDKYRVILTTADFQKGYEYPIKAEELNRKVLAFRDVLQNPKLDPLPLAQELYKILVGPVAKDLQGTKAQMVMWSLDGVLRYLPVAALHDGKQYVVEKYRTAVFTPASQSRLRVEPSRKWTALGLGVTKAHGENIPALPGVLDEMRGIIKAEGASSGVLPGSIKLDEAFTQEAMLSELRKRNPVVHIASHFRFQPGNETNSALLLGDGQFLSLAQIKSLPNVFAGVDLLTLSACNTATGGAANGKEVEGFGVLAQRQGAKAVVASLWPVADRSTKNLMQEFYRLREAKADVTKVEALRQAQIKLLRGELQVTGEALAAREIVHEAAKVTNQPQFKPDPKAAYAHPYYWAPFILIGNWK